MNTSVALRIAAHVFAVMAVYISAVEAPARRELSPQEALRQWQASFPRAMRIQATLAATACATALGAWIYGGLKTHRLLLGGLAVGAVIPITFWLISPINIRLLDRKIAATLDDAELRALLDGWEQRHALRTAVSLVAVVALLPRFPVLWRHAVA